MEMDTKQSLLRAAEELFCSKGFGGTSVKEICDRAGVNVSLVSYHFSGKEGLYQACLEQFGLEGLDMAERLLAHPKTPEEFVLRLKMFTEAVVLKHVEQPRLTRILHREVTMESPVAKEVFRRTFHRVFEAFKGFLESAKKQGILRKDLDPLLAAAIFFGSVSHLCNTDELRKDLYGAAMSIHDAKFRAKAVEQLSEVFLKGVQA